MKVLHVISDKNVGGAGVLLLNLLRCFDKKTIENVVALPRESALNEQLRAMGIPTVCLNYNCDRVSAASIREISKCIKNKRVELVHANAALCARIAGQICGIGVIHTRHCYFSIGGILRFPPIRFAAGFWNRILSDKVIATAEVAKENLKALGIPEKKICVILNGCREIRDADPTELSILRKSLGFNEENFVIGICARLEECKDHKTFLHAASLLLKEGENQKFRFLIIGDGTLRKTLEEYSNQLGISEFVKFVGFIDDPAPYYHLMRINVNCSIGTETSCLALSEGMSASLPMIASDYGGNRAMIGESEAGILYPPGDARALAAAISRIASNPSLESRMKVAARARYEQYYTAQRMASEVTALYRDFSKKRFQVLTL